MSMSKKKVYSGVRATGRLHLGNYLGAVEGMLSLQDDYECVFSVVDLHAITTPYVTKSLQQSIRDVVLDFLGAGLDPKKCLLEIQSRVPEHTELSYLLSTIYPVARLEDLPTYKDKRAQYPKYVNMGLLYYPVLMAADILLYKADLVPVGLDQEPHLEVAREIARKFNGMFGETFPEPLRFKTKGEYVPSLTGHGKMSKSVAGSYINLSDNLEIIKDKVAKIPTDSGKGDLGEQFVIERESSLFTILSLVELFEGQEKVERYKKMYISDGIRYKDLKDDLSHAIYKRIKPIQERRREYEENPQLVDEILEEHTTRCRRLALETLHEVKQKMGLI